MVDRQLKTEGFKPPQFTKVAAVPVGDTMYVPRIWNKDAILADGVGFRALLEKKLWENVGAKRVAKRPPHEQLAARDREIRSIPRESESVLRYDYRVGQGFRGYPYLERTA